MGNEMSAEEISEIRRKNKSILMRRFASYVKAGPDLRVNRNIVMFTSLSSSDNLRRHYERRRVELGDHAADWTKSLVEKLSGLTAAPELAGLGALAIAVLIDIVSSSPPEESTKEALRGVFAEQKASEVWDHIDECLKRCRMNINSRDDLKSDIKRIEYQLSAALTRLKNAMVRDGHMTSDGLRAWVNGAAFHVQMLIHLVRLGGTQTCDSVETLISTYESELSLLFTKHQEMIEDKCHVISRLNESNGPAIGYFRFMVDEESEWHDLDDECDYEEFFKAFYEYRYSGQKSEIEEYFCDVRGNLQNLVRQRGSFSVM
ncbi:uncharacterized protein [Pempheris klunzingeri]|uniref:uncharacterized protein n=1 Tax=Pempheris klunzingeri TaxID=3127111 RepID=UPI00398025C2